jgi:transposase
MTHLVGQDRLQTLLLPESLDDYVGPENPVRFIEAFVDGLDLAAVGFGRVRPKETGRPGYAPGDLLKLYIYGYLTRIRSSRRPEAETHRNVEVIWLLRHLRPDFKTIADFRRDNRNAFPPVFRQFVLLCKRSRFVRRLMAWRIVQQRRHKLVRELSAYNDHDLLDLGFSRADFPAIINGTYRR